MSRDLILKMQRSVEAEQNKVMRRDQTITDLEDEIEEWKLRFSEAMTGHGKDDAIKCNNPWKFTGRELTLVLALLRRPDGCAKAHLYDSLYGAEPGDTPEMKIVDVFICKVRSKFKKISGERMVETVWGQGYKIPEEARALVIEELGFDPVVNTRLDKLLLTL